MVVSAEVFVRALCIPHAGSMGSSAGRAWSVDDAPPMMSHCPHSGARV